MTPWETILRKALVGSNLDTLGWDAISSDLRNRAFFSAQVEEMRILHGMRENVAALAAGKKDPSEIRRDLRELLAEIGYDPGEQRGTIKDLLTKRRLDVMMQTNVQQARGYANHVRAIAPGAMLAAPAYELIRVKTRRVPRDWQSRWADAANKVNYSGVARGTPLMIAMKDSPIWSALSRFGNPFPPFDFNSGMGVRNVKKSVCRELGLLGPDEQPKIPAIPDFNGKLEASVPFAESSPEWQALKSRFGDQITFNGGNVRWVRA